MWDNMYGSAEASQYWALLLKRGIHRSWHKVAKWWRKYELDI